MRLQGFCEELAVSGLKPDWISRQDYNLESGERAAREWLALSRRPTAVFCSCDEVALGFMATLHREGVRIPQEVSVVGFDDIPFAGCSYPKLTTIQQPHQSIASAALQMILQRIQNDQAKVENCFLPGTLVVRESTAPLRGTASSENENSQNREEASWKEGPHICRPDLWADSSNCLKQKV